MTASLNCYCNGPGKLYLVRVTLHELFGVKPTTVPTCRDHGFGVTSSEPTTTNTDGRGIRLGSPLRAIVSFGGPQESGTHLVPGGELKSATSVPVVVSTQTDEEKKHRTTKILWEENVNRATLKAPREDNSINNGVSEETYVISNKVKDKYPDKIHGTERLKAVKDAKETEFVSGTKKESAYTARDMNSTGTTSSCASNVIETSVVFGSIGTKSQNFVASPSRANHSTSSPQKRTNIVDPTFSQVPEGCVCSPDDLQCLSVHVSVQQNDETMPLCQGKVVIPELEEGATQKKSLTLPLDTSHGVAVEGCAVHSHLDSFRNDGMLPPGVLGRTKSTHVSPAKKLKNGLNRIFNRTNRQERSRHLHAHHATNRGTFDCDVDVKHARMGNNKTSRDTNLLFYLASDAYLRVSLEVKRLENTAEAPSADNVDDANRSHLIKHEHFEPQRLHDGEESIEVEFTSNNKVTTTRLYPGSSSAQQENSTDNQVNTMINYQDPSVSETASSSDNATFSSDDAQCGSVEEPSGHFEEYQGKNIECKDNKMVTSFLERAHCSCIASSAMKEVAPFGTNPEAHSVHSMRRGSTECRNYHSHGKGRNLKSKSSLSDKSEHPSNEQYVLNTLSLNGDVDDRHRPSSTCTYSAVDESGESFVQGTKLKFLDNVERIGIAVEDAMRELQIEIGLKKQTSSPWSYSYDEESTLLRSNSYDTTLSMSSLLWSSSYESALSSSTQSTTSTEQY